MTPQETIATIQPGDWVKLRKKSASAPHTKRGDTFRVDMVHPVDGSLRIWNPTTKEWGFLYPDEVKLIPAPVDSVSGFGDTESNPPVDSVSRAISRYRPKGTARGGEYFRFSYRSGKKMKHVHIRGGNTDSALANARCEEIREALAAGMSPAEIVKMIR